MTAIFAPARALVRCCFVAVLMSAPLAPSNAGSELKPLDDKPWTDWQAGELRDHPLAGKVWDAGAGAEISFAELAKALAGAHFLALGEIHDNPDHHRLQAWGIRARAAGKRRPAVIMEMLNDDQRPALDSFYGVAGNCCQIVLADELLKKLNWAKSGWPDQKIYKPIIVASLAKRLKLHPGSASRTVVRGIGKNGYANLGSDKVTELGLDKELSPGLFKALGAELKEGHCDMLPDRAIPAMAKVQRYRDAVMAQRVAMEGRPHGTILIAGNGHVRLDRAVPWYLRRIAPDKTIVSVMMLEVQEGESDPAGYVEKDPDGRPATDYIVFTPRQTREDQCEKLRKMFGKKK